MASGLSDITEAFRRDVAKREAERSGRSSPAPARNDRDSSPTSDLVISPRTGLPVRRDVLEAQKEPVSRAPSPVRDARDFLANLDGVSVDPFAEQVFQQSSSGLSPGVLREASPRPGPVRSFARDVGTSFATFSGLRSDPSQVERVRAGVGSVGEEIGGLVGGVAFGAAGEVGQGLGTAARTARIALQGSRLGRAARSTQVGRFGLDLTILSGRGVGIVEAGRLLGQSRSPELGRSVVTSDVGREAVRAGRGAERDFVSQSGLLRQIGFELIGSPVSGRGGRSAFESGVRESLRGSGLDPLSVSAGVSAAGRERGFTNVAELTALLDISRGVERFGRAEISRSLAGRGLDVTRRRGLKGATATAGTIGRAGFIEGFGQELSQQRSRLESFDFGRAAGMGAVGALSAATLGGAIAGSAIAGKTKTSALLESGANIVDLFEKPGDILADIGERVTTRAIRGRARRVPIFTPGVSPGGIREVDPGISRIDPLFRQFPSAPVTTFSLDGVSLGSSVVTGDPSPDVAPSLDSGVGVSTPSVVDVPSLFDEPRKSGRSRPRPAPTPPISPPVEPIVPIPSAPLVPVRSDVPVLTESRTSVSTTVGVPSLQTSVSVPVPVVVPDIPFLPLGSPGFFSGRRVRSRKKDVPTATVFQQFFDINPVVAGQVGGASELTGLFLRDVPGRVKKKKNKRISSFSDYLRF